MTVAQLNGLLKENADLKAKLSQVKSQCAALRKALQEAESPCTCGQGRFGILHTHDCAISLRNTALKGEAK